MQLTANSKTLLNPSLKTLLIMKFTAFFLLVACLQVTAKGTAQITLSEKKAPLEKVLKAIKQQSGYALFYDEVLLKEKGKPVDINLQNVTVEQALKMVFNDQTLTYEIAGKIISVKEKETPKNAEAAPAAPAVPIDITGKITDKDGYPLNGASVKVRGSSTKGVTTGADGSFVLKAVDGSATLEISFIGYETITVSVNNKTTVTASLNAAITSLEDVVVNKGYYSIKQRENTGSVSTVKAEDIAKQPVFNPLMALEGKVAGLSIQQSSGIPGAGLIVQLRGQNSIANGNNPLYIVDGIPFTSTSLTNSLIGGGALGIPASNNTLGMSPFNNLNPSDIESIDVLKDADATAIYGSRGANGVILITTKKGKAGTTKLDLNVYTGYGAVTRMMDLLNTQQYLQMRRKAYNNDGVAVPSIITTPTNTAYDINGTWDTTRNTDWQKVLIGGTARYTNAQASISGGNSNTQFLLSGNYSRQTTVFQGGYADQKASLNASINHSSVNQKFKLLFSMQYVNDNSVLPQTDFTTVIKLAPDAPALYDANGNFNWQNNTWANPLIGTLKSAKAVTDNLLGNLSLSYEIFPGLQAKASIGYTHMEMNQSNQTPATAFYVQGIATNRTNLVANSNINTWITEPQLDYNKTIRSGKLEVLLGTTLQQNIQNSTALLASDFSTDALIPNIAAASGVTLPPGTGYTYSQYKYNAIYGRLSYNLQDKYIINLTGRRDGSSRFGPGNQFGNFGSVGAGWIFNKEKFVQNVLPFLSFGKLRASYGSVGNDQIADYQYLSTYVFSSTYQGVTGVAPNRIGTPTLGGNWLRNWISGLNWGYSKTALILARIITATGQATNWSGTHYRALPAS